MGGIKLDDSSGSAGGRISLSRAGAYVVSMLIAVSLGMNLGSAKDLNARLFLISQDSDVLPGIIATDGFTPSEQHRERKLGDGCFHIFLDVGANMGVHGRFLLEPQKYPLAIESAKIFNEYFGADRDNRDICVFEFEPNPRHKEKLFQNAKAYEAMGWRYHVIPSGVAMAEGVLTFYSRKGGYQDDFRVERPPRGASTVVNATVINFSSWLHQNIFDRQIPSTTFGSYTGKQAIPKILMKMDIERLEFDLIPELIVTGSLCKLDFAFVEMHGTGPHHGELKRAWDKVLGAAQSCQSFRYINADDESYALDGIPLPEPPASH